MELPRSMRALANRNFRLFFAGQTISLVGTWMQQVAMAWVVYELTGSAWWLGIAGFTGQVPSFFLGPIAGALVDRWNRYRLLLVTQTLAMMQAFIVAWLILSGDITVWQILTLSLCLGMVNAFDMPTRQSFLVEMVGRDHLPNAIALNSAMVNAARLVGPAMAGLVLATTSAGVCFLINAISYLAVLSALLAMTVSPRTPPPRGKDLLAEVREGLVYAFGFKPIRAILLLLALVSLMGLSYSSILQDLNQRMLNGDATSFGLLMSSAGVGALMAAVKMTRRESVLGLGKWIAASPGILGAALLAFSFTSQVWLACLILVVAGFAVMTLLAASNTIVQTIVEEDKRGRVMSLFTMAFMGISPLGSLLAGYLAEALGGPTMLRIGGVCCLVGAGLFTVQLPAIRVLIRPLYRAKGILPEIYGVQPAAEFGVAPREK